ncbi:MAG: VOC family protein [Sphingomonadaceae bacterium]|nr:VOC family protein [Sphingomonadaceae bacterium]
MLGYITLGTNDLDASRAYYDALLGEIGAKRLMVMEENGFTMYGVEFGQPALCVTKPYDGNPATVGNGMMAAIIVDDRAKVDQLYAKAMELGSQDEGGPGVRGEEGDQAFYAAYFRDPDGNKLCAFKVGPAG